MSFASPRGLGSPCVSVILPTYERAGVLGRSIQSVLAQTYRDFELIIVDDASEDETEAVVARIDDPRIVYCREDQNRGPAAARNTGIRRARGDFLAFHDSDDEWLPAKLERHIEAFSFVGTDTAVTYSDMVRIDRNGNTRPHRSPDITPGRMIDPDTRFYQVYGLGIIATVMRRSCLDQGLRFDERFRCFEDLELFLRISSRSRFHHIREPLVRYYENEGVSTDLRNQLRARRRLLRLYRADLIRRHPRFFVNETLKVQKGLLDLALTEGRTRRAPHGGGRAD
jgi:glycosyltransferase involved in cell wall biosynthesis